MRCERCGGFQLQCHFMYRKSTTAPWEYDGWRCLNCGEIVDPLILLNRSLQGKMNDLVPARPYDGGRVIWLKPRQDVAV